MKSISSSILVLILPVFLCPYAVFAEDQVIFSMEAGKCSLSVESNDRWNTLRLRVKPERQDCHIAKESMLAALKAAFSKSDPPKLEGTYSSLSIGRLIDYPWLSQYLALAASNDSAWDKKRGKPVNMDVNKYVSTMLSRKEITTPIEETFAGSGYRVATVTVEKVLIGGFRNVPLYQGKIVSGKFPYDAQVWFRIEKRGASFHSLP